MAVRFRLCCRDKRHEFVVDRVSEWTGGRTRIAKFPWRIFSATSSDGAAWNAKNTFVGDVVLLCRGV